MATYKIYRQCLRYREDCLPLTLSQDPNGYFICCGEVKEATDGGKTPNTFCLTARGIDIEAACDRRYFTDILCTISTAVAFMSALDDKNERRWALEHFEVKE